MDARNGYVYGVPEPAGRQSQLMNVWNKKSALDDARTLGAQTLWLGVWERNPRAIAFYHKCGFAHVGEHGFLFANEMQTDLVMARGI